MRLRHFRFALRASCSVAPGHFLVQSRLRVGKFRGKGARALLLGRLLCTDLRHFLRDLRTAFRGGLGRLLQLLQLELEVVTTALLRSECQTLGVPGVLRACRVRVDCSERLARGLRRRARARDR